MTMPAFATPSLPVRWAERCLRLYAAVTPTGRGAYRLLRAVRRLHARDEAKRRFTLPGGLRMDLDLGAYPDCTMAFGLYEVETAHAIRALLRPGDVFVDAGANVGYFSLLAAQCVGGAGQVHAFEPFPPNRERLRENVRANGWEDIIRIHGEALSDAAGEIEMHQYTAGAANHGQVTAFPQPGQGSRPVRVAATRLDAALPGIFPRLVKLDVEGSELLALRGMADAIRRSACAVIVEMNPDTFRSAGTSAVEIAGFLGALVPGYECRVLRWPARRIRPTARSLAALGEVNLLFSLPQPRQGSQP